MSEPYIGQISMFAGNFAPRGYLFCQGQLLAIAQNTALFSLLGTTYGGNGQTTFALPDLRSRLPVHTGQLPGGESYVAGQTGGTETVTLQLANLPPHNHGPLGASTTPTSATANSGLTIAGGINRFRPGPATQSLAPASMTSTGNSQPHENIQPYLCINFIIAVEGLYPSRN